MGDVALDRDIDFSEVLLSTMDVVGQINGRLQRTPAWKQAKASNWIVLRGLLCYTNPRHKESKEV
jgi:hypothetical protein